MVDRSDFQGAMLYWSAATFGSSLLLGDTGATLMDLGNTVQELANRLLPVDIIPQGDTLEEKAENFLDRGISALIASGWAITAMLAALWKRVQALGLLALSAVSGSTLGDTMILDGGTGDSMQMAASMLQAITFGTSSLGLATMAKDRVQQLRGAKRRVSQAVRSY